MDIIRKQNELELEYTKNLLGLQEEVAKELFEELKEIWYSDDHDTIIIDGRIERRSLDCMITKFKKATQQIESYKKKINDIQSNLNDTDIYI